jgi:hypothetical protein
MPFDGLVKADAVDLNRRSIDGVLASLGIQPVPHAVLERHKAEQVKRHPASFFHRHPSMHRLSILAGSIGSIASAFMFMSYNFVTSPGSIASLTALLTCLAATAELALFARIKRPAVWIETLASFDTGQARATVPASILNLVDQIGNASGEVRFAVGTLYQEHVVIDPYIIAETYEPVTKTATRACVGI